MITRSTPLNRLFSLCAAVLVIAFAIQAQTTRPRRTKQPQKTASTEKPASDQLLRPEPTATPAPRRTSSNDSLLDVQPVKPVANTVSAADTKHAYLLLEQKQFAA